MITLTQVKEKQPAWFSPKNREFFGDISYKVLQGGVSEKPYLVRSTYAWTGLMGGEKNLHYRINPIGEDLKIESLTDKVFYTIEDVKAWLKEN